MRPATATVPVSGAHRPFSGRVDATLADRLSITRLSAVLLGPVAVPKRTDRRASRHTHLAHADHTVRHRRPGAHRLQIRPIRLTRTRGPRAYGVSQRDRAQPFIDRPSH